MTGTPMGRMPVQPAHGFAPAADTALRDRVRRLAQRSAVMLSGELMQSAFHFGLNLLLMRTLSPGEYGTFAIVFLTGGLSLTYMRSIAGLPANLFIPPHAGTRRAVPYELAFGSMAVLVSAVAALVVVVILHGWLGRNVFAGALFVGVWTLRSYVRSILFAKGLRGIATVSDLVFTVSGAALACLLLLVVPATDPLCAVFLLLATANTLSIACALAMQGHWPRLTVRRSAVWCYSRIGREVLWSVAGTTTTNIQGQGQVLLLAAFVGPGGYAPIAAMMVFFAPLRLTTAALTNMVQPELSALWTGGRRDKAMQLVWLWTLGLALLGVAYGAVLMVAFSLVSIPIFDGQPMRRIAVLSWLVAMPPVLYLMPKLVLEVRRAFQVVAVIGLGAAAVGMGIVFVVLDNWGSPSWALLGSVAAEIVVLAGCWIALFRRDGVAAAQTGRAAATPPRPAADPAGPRPC